MVREWYGIAFYCSQPHSNIHKHTAPTFLHGYQSCLLQRLNSREGEGSDRKRGRVNEAVFFFFLVRVLQFCFNFLCYSGMCVSGYVIGCGSLCSRAILHRWTHSKTRYWEIKYRKRKQNQCNVRKVSWLWFKAAQAIPQLTVSSSLFNLCWWGVWGGGGRSNFTEW